jgi:hypothetical protein
MTVEQLLNAYFLEVQSSRLFPVPEEDRADHRLFLRA